MTIRNLRIRDARDIVALQARTFGCDVFAALAALNAALTVLVFAVAS